MSRRFDDVGLGNYSQPKRLKAPYLIQTNILRAKNTHLMSTSERLRSHYTEFHQGVLSETTRRTYKNNWSFPRDHYL